PYSHYLTVVMEGKTQIEHSALHLYSSPELSVPHYHTPLKQYLRSLDLLARLPEETLARSETHNHHLTNQEKEKTFYQNPYLYAHSKVFSNLHDLDQTL